MLISSALFFLPYLLLAYVAARARGAVVLLALSLLVAGSVVGYLAARSDAQGGFIYLYVLPAQLIAAWIAGHDRFRRR